MRDEDILKKKRGVVERGDKGKPWKSGEEWGGMIEKGRKG